MVVGGQAVLRQRKTAYAKILSRRGVLSIVPGVQILFFFFCIFIDLFGLVGS